MAESVEMVRVEEEEKRRAEEQRRREEELRVAREKEAAEKLADELRKKAEEMKTAADDIEMDDAEALAELEAGSSYIAKHGDCINCKVKRQECIRPR